MVKLFPAGTRTLVVDLVAAGLSVVEVRELTGVGRTTIARWWQQCGGMSISLGPNGGIADPAPLVDTVGARGLSFEDRAMIQMGLRQGLSYAALGKIIGRNRSVVWREVHRHRAEDGVYYASAAHTKAHQNRRRPKPFILIENSALCRQIEQWMDDGWSPRLISAMLASEFPDDQTMRVSHETIYQALYVQTRGTLRADLAKQLSLQRKKRLPHGAPRKKNNSPYKQAFRISERPAEVADRAVPGHWEGDLIIGSDSSAIGTLVERSTRFTILLHLPAGHSADEVADAMIQEMKNLPEHLRRSVTWDRGTELAAYKRIQTALDMTLYFCDPHSPWQRGTNENTNRLLRFWFEKGSDLTAHSSEDLKRVAATLNRRPRPTLGLETPANKLSQLLLAA